MNKEKISIKNSNLEAIKRKADIRGSEILTSFVHHEVSGTKLMSVDVLDWDQVVGADVLLQVAILPHHIGYGLCGHDLHRNAEGTRMSTENSRGLGSRLRTGGLLAGSPGADADR